MEKSLSLYFLAIIPPDEIQSEITQIKLDFKSIFNSQHALKSPPHITLFPPFQYHADKETKLTHALNTFCSSLDPFEQILSGFGSFPPKVIYIGVNKNKMLLSLQTRLSSTFRELLKHDDFKKNKHHFSPHVTLAFRDLSIENFRIAWKTYEKKKILFHFAVDRIGLLKHNGKNWDIIHKSIFKL